MLSKHRSVVTGLEGLATGLEIDAESLATGERLPIADTVLAKNLATWRAWLAEALIEKEHSVLMGVTIQRYFRALSNSERLFTFGRLLADRSVTSVALALGLIHDNGHRWIFENRDFLAAKLGWPVREFLAYYGGYGIPHPERAPLITDERVPGKITIDFKGTDPTELLRDFVRRLRTAPRNACSARLEA